LTETSPRRTAQFPTGRRTSSLRFDPFACIDAGNWKSGVRQQKNFCAPGKKLLFAEKRFLTAVKIVQDIEFPTTAFGNSLLFKRK
jgi:hypothetical protein